MDTRFHLSPADRQAFDQLITDSIQEEQRRQQEAVAAGIRRLSTEDSIREVAAKANDFEKYWFVDHARQGRASIGMGLQAIRSMYATELVNENYDAYTWAEANDLGDFNLVEVQRDANQKPIAVTCEIHADRFAWAAEPLSHASDRVTTITLTPETHPQGYPA